MAGLVFDDLPTGPSKLGFPGGAFPSVICKGNKFYIDAVWVHGASASIATASEWRELVGTSLALGAMLSMLAFMIMMVVGTATWSTTIFHAFYAVPAMFLFMLAATLTGHAHLLPTLTKSMTGRAIPASGMITLASLRITGTSVWRIRRS